MDMLDMGITWYHCMTPDSIETIGSPSWTMVSGLPLTSPQDILPIEKEYRAYKNIKEELQKAQLRRWWQWWMVFGLLVLSISPQMEDPL